jgi:hypothetical protein
VKLLGIELDDCISFTPHFKQREGMACRALGHVGWTSDVLGDPPPDPRFLASLGALSWVELIVGRADLLTGPSDLDVRSGR